MTRPEVVVTGVGPATPLGVGAADFLAGQLAGRGATRTISRIGAADLPVRIAGEVDLPAELTLDRRQTAGTDRTVHLAAAAANLALADSGLDLAAVDPERVGVVIANALGGADAWERASRASEGPGLSAVSPRFIPMAMGNGAAAWISRRYGFTGPSSAVALACASGAEALVHAHQMIASGEADVVLAGGTEAPITRTIVSGFAAMHALSRRNDDPGAACRPFGRDRDGFVLAEGAAVLVLESSEHAARRGAEPYGALAGYGRSCDAYSMTAPQPDGSAGAQAVRSALRMAGLTAEDVGYVNAHGTATRHNDAAEAQVLRVAFGPLAGTVPVSATKSMTGHALAAAGAIEAVAAVQALAHKVVPPTANAEDPDPELGLSLVSGQPRDAMSGAVLSNSFAFGGHNVVLAFTRC